MMWNPSHVQFTVLRARNLVSKGKGGNNDVFVTIQLGKEKYQTSTIKNAHHPEWFEECDLPIPHMHSEIEVSIYHRGVLSDDFLGYAAIALWEHKVGERPKSQWVPLQNKPSKGQDSKYRGELEIKLTFHVESRSNVISGLKKRSSSIKSLATAVGDKLKLTRSKSFRENRKDPEGGKSDKKQWRGTNDCPRGQDQEAFAYLQNEANSRANLHPADLSPVNFPALDVDRSAWNDTDNSAVDVLSRSYSLSAAQIKSLSLDRSRVMSQVEATPTQRDDARSKSLYNIPGNRQSCVEFSNYTIPPPPYDPQRSSQDDSALVQRERPRPPNPPRLPLGSNSSYLDSIMRRERTMYESIKERTEESSSSEDNDASRPRLRPFRIVPKEPNRDFDADVESVEESPVKPAEIVLENGGQGETTLPLPGQDVSGEPEHSNAVSERLEVIPNGVHVKEEGRDRGDNTRKKIVPNMKDIISPVHSHQRENGQSDVVVMRKKTKRDKLRQLYKQGGRRYTVQGLDYRGLYDESPSDLSDSTKQNGLHVNHEDLIAMYKNLTKDELVRLVIQNKAQMIRKDRYIGDLENYIDDLLVRVMETQPKLLHRPTRRF